MASLFRFTRSTHPAPQRHALAAAALLATTPVWAQTTSSNDTQLPAVVVTGRTTPTAGIAGWGDVPLARTPLQARVFDTEQLKDRGVQRLSDLTASDASVSDAYNTEGYVDYLTVRGFVVDNRFNFRRDGLPINAETSIPLENKARIEILKGTSGMQAGTSAPGGLVNYVVKRPLDTALRSASIEWREAGSVTGALDLSQRFGAADAFGLRLNAVAAHLDPKVNAAQGERRALALAGDWRLSADTLIEVEFETSHRSQPSVPGFSMLGNVVPAPGDPNINLNNQPWSLPVVFDGNTGSVRWQQRLADGWRLTTHLATQRLRTDDRIAFPFGCTDPNPPPDGTYYADRYCPDGTLDLYDFRSDNERRRTDALDVSLQGRITTGTLSHALTAGVLHSRVRNRFQQQAFNFAGTGNVDGTAVTPAAPALTGENTNRDERSTELYLRDAVTVSERFTAWLGLRHTRLQRESVGTDGSQPTDYTQSFTTPFIATSFSLTPEQLVYASWGQGIESEVTPNLPRYGTPTKPLPALKSRQVEIGVKATGAQHEWGVAVFDIVRPLFADFGSCDLDNTCTRQADGTQHHRGIEANTALRLDAWALRGSAQWLRARREGGQDAALNGLQPTNVPARTVKLQAGYTVPQWAGLSLLGSLQYESARMVLPDNSARIPGYTRTDLAARYDMRVAAGLLTWRVGVDNLFDQRAWRESPYQFGHAYLFPQAARTWRVSVQADL